MIAPNGNLLLHMWRSDYAVDFDGTYQSVSTDGGKTWSTPAQITFTGLTAEQNALTFCTDDNFVYDGVIYAGGRIFSDQAASYGKSVLVKSTDNGATWSWVSDITDFDTNPTSEVGIEYLGEGRIIAMLRPRGTATTKRTYSDDMGATWGAIVDIGPTMGASGRHRLQTGAHLRGEENWWTDETLIMVGFKSASGRINTVWVSMDAGLTWSGYPVDTVAEDGGYGDMIYNPTTGKYICLSYRGTQGAADIKQYTITMTGL